MTDLLGKEILVTDKVVKCIGDPAGTVLEIRGEYLTVQWPDGTIEDDIMGVDVLKVGGSFK